MSGGSSKLTIVTSFENVISGTDVYLGKETQVSFMTEAENLCAVSCPLVIFYHPRVLSESVILEWRGGAPTLLVPSTKESRPLSRMEMLDQTARENRFGSEYFLWLDGSAMKEKPRDVWPDERKLASFGDSLIIPSTEGDRVRYCSLYFILGKKDIIHKVAAASSKVHKEFDEYKVLHQLRKKYPGWFQLHTYDQLVRIPKNSIVHDLSLKADYPVDRRLHLVTVASAGLQGTEKWEKTAQRFGYRHTIAGRNEPWRGFRSKMQGFLTTMEQNFEPYFVLTDCTDVFFSGSSAEMIEKFESMNADVVVGVEDNCSCPHIKYPYQAMKKHFEDRGKLHNAPGSQVFPNTGFMMGKREKLIEVMRHHIQHVDDQAACFESIYEGKFNIVLDYHTKLVANFPRWKRDVSSEFIFNESIGRYVNSRTGEAPPAFHFPGCNWRVMRPFYERLNPEDLFVVPAPVAAAWVLGVILVLLALFIVVIFAMYPQQLISA